MSRLFCVSRGAYDGFTSIAGSSFAIFSLPHVYSSLKKLLIKRYYVWDDETARVELMVHELMSQWMCVSSLCTDMFLPFLYTLTLILDDVSTSQ